MTAPGAAATQLASRVWYEEIDGKPQSPGWIIQAYARAIQQYGDERAAAALAERFVRKERVPFVVNREEI